MQGEGVRWAQTDRTRTPPVAWGRVEGNFQAPGEEGDWRWKQAGSGTTQWGDGTKSVVQAEADDYGDMSGQG